MSILLLTCLCISTSLGQSPARPLSSYVQSLSAPDLPFPGDATTRGYDLRDARTIGKERPTVSPIEENNFPDWYSDFLDEIIRKLDEWISRTTNPDQNDLDRISCAISLNSLVRHKGASWTIAMLDSSSKLQSGLLEGNLNDLGMYDQCVGVRVSSNLTDPYSTTFSGQHCLVTFNFYLDGKKDEVEVMGGNWIPLTVSHCYPSVCTAEVLEELLNGVLALPDSALNLFGVSFSVDVSINPADCQVKDRGPYDFLEWFIAAIIVLFSLICGFSTAFDYFYLSREVWNRRTWFVDDVVLAFSAYRNVSELLDTRHPTDYMTSLSGMKVLSISWVVLDHRYRYLLIEPVVNLVDIPKKLQIWEMMLILSGPLTFDTFFLISGLLNMYLFALIRERTPFSVYETLIMYIHRYLRLTPPYLVMIGVTATWLYRAGDGPYWGRLVGTSKLECRNNFWQNLVYLNNYLDPDHYCMMQSWYLSAEMQMFFLSPLVVFPLWRWPIIGMVEVVFLIIASILSPMLISYFYQIRAPFPLTTDAEKFLRETATLYLTTHTKAVSYVVGILAGYLVYNLKRNKIKFQPGKVTLGIFWLASALCMFYAMSGGYWVYELDDNYDPIYSAFYIGFFRFFWSIGVVWIIIACVCGFGGPVNALLSWPVFQPLSRLTYGVFLTHVAVILRSVASTRVPVYFSGFGQYELYMGDLVISFGAAFILSLLFEIPILKLDRIIFGRGSREPLNPRRQSMSEDRHCHTA